VGVAQFTPPELQKSKDFKMLRTQNHDNFGLSVLIFLLLFMGRHPFSGVYRGKDDMPIERAIAEYRFAFSKGAALRAMNPPPNSIGLSVVPGEIANMFEQAFTESGVQERPSANDWWNVLDALEKRLRKCPVESKHTFYSGINSCPWCTLENKSGILLFLSSDAISRVDLNSEWQKVLSIKPPGPIPEISPGKFPCQPRPLSPFETRALRWGWVRLGVVSLFLILGAILTVFGVFAGMDTNPLVGIAGPVLIGVAVALYLVPGRDKTEKKRRKKEFEDARYSWRLWEKKWKSDAGDGEFNTQLNSLSTARNRYEAIEREYKNALANLESTSRERQLKRFLENCFIDTCNSPRLSENQKAALRSFGIETAADVSFARIAGIQGFDTTTAANLAKWRQQQESRFVFDGEKRVSAGDVQGLIHAYQPKIRPVERDILTGVEKLHATREQIMRSRAKIQPIMEKSARDLSQAHANLAVFSLSATFW